LKNFLRDNKGTAAVLIAVFMTTILGFCALVVDVGRVSLEKSRIQNAVDSAAIAAARDLPNTTNATNTANDYIAKNGYDNISLSISFARSNRQITVEAVQTMEYAFARIIGLNSANVRGTATAEKGGRYLGGAFDYAVFSGSTNDELTINSNGQSTYIDGSVHSNNKFRYNGNHDPIPTKISTMIFT